LIFQKTDAGKLSPFWSVDKKNQQNKQLGQVDIDIAAIRAYGEEIKTTTDYTAAMEETMGKATNAAKEFAKGGDFSRKAVMGFRRSQEESIKTTKSFSSSLHGLSSVLKNVGLSLLNMGAMMLASVAITKTVEAIDQIIRRDEIAIEKANELADVWEKSSDTLESNKRTLDGISEEYTRLSKGVDSFGKNVSLTSEEYSRYNDLANQIADMFPELVSGWTSEGNAILKVKGNIDQLNDAYEQARANLNDTILKQAPEAISGAYLQLFGKGSLFDTKTSGTQDRIKLIDDIVGQLEAFGDASGFLIQDVASLNEILNGANIKDTINVKSEVQNNIKALELYKRTLENTAIAQTSVYKRQGNSYLETTKEFKIMSDEAKAMSYTIINSLSPAMFEQFGEDYLQYFQWIQKNIIESIGTIDLADIINTKSLFDTDKISFGTYEKAFKTFEKSISGMAPEVQSALSETFAPDPENLVEAVKAKLSTGKELVSGLSLGDLKLAANFTLKNASFAQLTAQIAQAKTTALQTVESLSGEIPKISEAYTLLGSALGEQSESGSVSYETYTKLIAANEDFANAITVVDGQLQIDADRAYEAADAHTKLQQSLAEAAQAAKQTEYDEVADKLEGVNKQLEEMAEIGYENDLYDNLIDQKEALESQQDVLEKELRQYQAITGQIKGMTTAYAKFKRAQETPNQGALYDEASGTIKGVLKDAIKSKALNTDDAKRAIDFYAGEGDESQAGLEKRSKRAEEIANRYFTEKDPLVGLGNFQEDLLSKKKMGSLSSFFSSGKDGFKIADGVTAADIAKQLDMSETALYSMLKKIQEYDADAKLDMDQLFPQGTEEFEKEESAVLQAAEKLTTDTDSYVKTTEENIKRVEDVNQKYADALAGKTPETPETPSPAPTQPNGGSTAGSSGAGSFGWTGATSGGGGKFETPPTVTIPPQEVTITLAIAEGELEGIKADITGLKGDATITTNALDVSQLLSLLGVDIEDIPDGDVKLTLTDEDGTISQVSTLSEAMEAIRQGANPSVTITLPEDTTQAELDALNASLAALPPETKSEIVIDASNVKGAVDSANTELDNLKNKEFKITADGSSVPETVADANSETAKTNDHEAQITANGSTIGDSVEAANTETDKVQDKTALIDANTGYIAGDVEKANELLGGVEDPVADITVDGSTVADGVAAANAESAKVEDRVITITTVHEGGGGGFGESGSTKSDGGTSSGTGDFSGNGGTSGYGGGRSPKLEQPADIVNTDNIETAIAKMTIFEAIWLKIKSFFTDDEYLVDTVISPAAQAEVDNTKDGLGEIASTEIPSKPVSIDDKKAREDLVTFEDRADDTVEKKVNVTYSGGGGSFAKGTKHAPEGIALVDEKGAELIEHKDGTFELGTNNGPRFTALDKGDAVHNSDDTKKILHRGLKPNLQVGNRFESGWNLPDPVGGGGRSNSSSSKKNTKKFDWKKYFDRLFDWIEIRLERLQEVTDKWTRQIEKAVGFINKNKAIDSAIASISTQIAALEEAAIRYEQQAADVAKKSKLSPSIIDKIKNGTMDITMYSGDTKKKIQEYMDWYEKAKAAREEVENLKDEQEELIHQKMDNIIKQYDDIAGAAEDARSRAEALIDNRRSSGQNITEADYQPAIEAQRQNIIALQQQYLALKAEFDKQVAEGTLIEGSDVYNEYLDKLRDLDIAVIDAQTDFNDLSNEVKQLANLRLTNLLSDLQTIQSELERNQSLIEAQGRSITTANLREMIANGMQQIENLKLTNALLLQQQQGLDANSEKYRDIQDQINSNNESISDVMVSQEQWNDSILDIRIDELERMKETLEKTNDEFERQRDLEQAIEDLERAKSQRKIRIFENGQFTYKADTQDVAEKQRALDQKLHDQTLNKIDEAIDAIEKLKPENNVYAAQGISPTSLAELFPGASVNDLITGVMASINAGASLSELAQSMNHSAASMMNAVNNTTNSPNVTVAAGAIQIIGVTDPDKVANAVFEKLATEMGAEITTQMYDR
jgi:uncharacterized membrane protein YgcG